MFKFNNTYTKLPKKLFTRINPVPVQEPKLVVLNKLLLKELGIDNNSLTEYLSGNQNPLGSEPIAQAYAGHQFGHLNILGDGRAILIGEHTTPLNITYDIQLKGSGRTPYSRGGDGRATLYSMLREYLISFAMEKLNIPTTRSLSVVSTGENVYREKPTPGGILTRVASSHIRVGTFQFVAMQGDFNNLKIFTDYVINRHYPHIANSKNTYLLLLEEVMIRQIDLIVDWYRVGFIHGVMNTDNVSICGETIDYGPCAFIDNYNPNTVFSSIDHNGRYSFDNQKNIGGWNIARFAECLIPIISDNTDNSLKLVNEVLEKYKDLFNEKYKIMMAKKIGISSPDQNDFDLVDELLKIMKLNNMDYTKTFRNLHLKNETRLNEWFKKWELRNVDLLLLKQSNPAVIPRNYIVEEVLIEASENSNMVPFNKFLEVLSDPYVDKMDDFYKNPPVKVDENYKTFCGT